MSRAGSERAGLQGLDDAEGLGIGVLGEGRRGVFGRGRSEGDGDEERRGASDAGRGSTWHPATVRKVVLSRS